MATTEGTKGGDVLVGTDFAEALFGKKGNDVLIGNDGNDNLAGHKGKDILIGGDGDDILAGGKGKDTLVGGDGADTFVFAGKSGKDTIVDFNVDTDVLQIKSTSKITSVEDVIGRASENKHGDTVINLGGGDKVVLKGVSLSDFSEDPDSHIDIV